MPDGALKPQWFQILLALAGGALHGSAIMEEVLERTDGEMKLWPATLYGSLRDLEGRGWIEEADPPEGAPTEGGKRRFYALSEAGREALAAETRRFEGWVRVARSRAVLDEANPA
ncbi:MAG: PadR family transcriptional regulator [Gemmatimonadetes bacterium]|nr:PadR family transcriptional regulator [Gemmatimonadota bacterium]NNF37053.1 PadR family transcriptional regulator [Gemmatimonadota bacterium]